MNRTVLWATLGCLVAQIAMVEAGHAMPALQSPGFAIGGTTISLIAGLVAGRGSRSALGALGNGALAGGLGALIGIALSAWHGDVPASLLGMGTGASTLAGMIGATLTHGLRRPDAR
jgi:hypothetical protein